MMDDKAESEFIRAEYVDGKFREHDRKHKADMEGVKKSFEQAAAKHNELRGEVDQMKNSIVAIQAEVKSLREMMVLYFQKGSAVAGNTVTEEIETPPLEDEWVNATDALNLIREQHLCVIKFGDIGAALVWAGYAEKFPSDGGQLKLTDEGCKIKYIKPNPAHTHVLIKRSNIQEIANLIEDYHDFLRNARRGK